MQGFALSIGLRSSWDEGGPNGIIASRMDICLEGTSPTRLSVIDGE